MGWLLLLLLGVAYPVGVAQGQAASSATVLARPVRIPHTGILTLAQALGLLSRQSGVPISYSSSRIGAGRRCQLRGGPARPLGAVLAEVLAPAGVAAGLLGGQVVLWPVREPMPAGVVLAVAPAVPLAAGGAAKPMSKTAVNDEAAAKRSVGSVGPIKSLLVARREAQPGAGAENRSKTRAFRSLHSSLTGVVVSSESSRSPKRTGQALKVLLPLAARPVIAFVPLAQPQPSALVCLALPPASARLALARRLVQVSLVPPLSTNGVANSRTVNALSLNIGAGYAAGVRGAEIGGLLNVVRDSVRGVQAAGLLNLTGTDVRGVQLAGLGNVGGGGMRGLQAAGSFNVARDDVRGLQVAGLFNLVGGAGRARLRPGQPTRVRRWLGLPRLLATDPGASLPASPSTGQAGRLVQAAGLANLTGTDVRGVQTATFLNVARRVRGFQFGLVNVARSVHGVQFGLLNFADSATGVPVGLFNIVHRNGYRRGEVWTSESLPLNAVFKLGVQRYYTIFGAAAEPFANRVEWAAGFGLGTAGRPHGRFTLSLDLVQWTLAGSTADPDAARVDTRLLTQLRPALAWQIEAQGHLQLVVSPTLNLAVAWQNDGQPAWDFGAGQWLWINTAGPQSRTRLWPGVQLGLRF